MSVKSFKKQAPCRALKYKIRFKEGNSYKRTSLLQNGINNGLEEFCDIASWVRIHNTPIVS
jgi:hypothetical protein